MTRGTLPPDKDNVKKGAESAIIRELKKNPDLVHLTPRTKLSTIWMAKLIM